MQDVKIDINPMGFPSQFVSDSTKKTLEFGLQIGQAIQYEWFRKDGNTNRFYNQWGDFHRLRLYARGEQSVSKYKNELAVDGDLSYLNLDWTPVPIIPKFVDIVVNGMSDRIFQVKAYAQDAMSMDRRNEYQRMIAADMASKELITQVNKDFDISILKDYLTKENLEKPFINNKLINYAIFNPFSTTLSGCRRITSSPELTTPKIKHSLI